MGKSKIEYINGEPFCRYNGVLMSEENCIKMFGTDCTECILSEKYIEFPVGKGDKYIIYTDYPINKIIPMLASATTGPAGEYDEIINQGYGYNSWLKDKEYENSYIIPKNNISGLKAIKSIDDFKKRYPKIKIKEIVEFNKELNKYLDNL